MMSTIEWFHCIHTLKVLVSAVKKGCRSEEFKMKFTVVGL